MMREATYTDPEGRMWAVWLPEGVPDEQASEGIPRGPISLEPLGLPLDFEIRLHNQLFHRGLLTATDVRKRRTEVQAALMAALKVDAGRILALYDE